MNRFLMGFVVGIALASVMVTNAVEAQTTSPQEAVSSSSPGTTPSKDSAQAPPADSEPTVDPASLLPDLPSLPKENASLIGGTVQKLDRVRDQITVQVFGGGKMKIAFDTRTHIYQGDGQGSLADLHQGDRVYVDTILDGSTVLAKTIRLKSTASAGESQGIVTSYHADKSELEVRDALSPRPLKIHLTPQTKITHGDHATSASELVTGTLVAIKFGAQKGGQDVAREISVLAVPGASFTFAGRVTGLDLRLGLLVLTSSTDNKSYEIYFDPAVVNADSNLHQAADVTVLTRFDGNHYVANKVTVNSQNQR